MEITFLDANYLWLFLGLPLLLVLHFHSLKYVKIRAFKFANFEALRRVTGGMILSRNITLLVLRMFVLLFLTLSLAGAVIWYSGEVNVADYVLAIDSSGSMLADDFEPNRLEAAKEAAIMFTENIEPKSKIGIVSFSGVGLAELPLTENKLKVKNSIKGIGISSLHGTSIGDALKTSANLLVSSDKSKIIILLTDGRQNIASRKELDKIIEYVKASQITVNTIGVATKAGGTLPGLNILSTLDEDTLSSVADSTGGVYIHSENKGDIIDAYKSFTYESAEARIPIHLRLPFILVACLLLFIEWVLVNTRYRTIP